MAPLVIVVMLGAGISPVAGADDVDGRVDAAGVAVADHDVQLASDGRLDAVLSWSGDAVLQLDVLSLDGVAQGGDGPGPGPRSVALPLPRGGYRLRVTAVSGAADYVLSTTATPAGSAWAGAVDASGQASRSQLLTVE